MTKVFGLGLILFFLRTLLGHGVLAQEKMKVTDLEKRIVEVPKNPERIIRFGPGSLRLICYWD